MVFSLLSLYYIHNIYFTQYGLTEYAGAPPASYLSYLRYSSSQTKRNPPSAQSVIQRSGHESDRYYAANKTRATAQLQCFTRALASAVPRGSRILTFPSEGWVREREATTGPQGRGRNARYHSTNLFCSKYRCKTRFRSQFHHLAMPRACSCSSFPLSPGACRLLLIINVAVKK